MFKHVYRNIALNNFTMIIKDFLDAFSEIQIFFDNFLISSITNADKIKQIELIEEEICNSPDTNIRTLLEKLIKVITKDNTDDEAIAPMVPTTIIEKLGQIVIDESPELELSLVALSILAKYGNNTEILQWIKLPKYLHQISNSTSSPTIQTLISTILQSFSKSKVSYKTMTVNKYNNLKQCFESDSVSFLGNEDSWKFQIRQMSYMDVGLAWKVWDSGLLLSQWIYNYPQLFRDKVILEIGSGCGPVGVVLAKMENAKSITLSDRINSVLDNIRFNLQLNDSTKNNTNVEVKYLDWTVADLPFEEHKAEILVASDVIYDLTASENVPDTIDRLLHPQGIAVVVLPSHREGIAKFEENMKVKGFTSERASCGSYSNSEDGSLNFYLFYKNKS